MADVVTAVRLNVSVTGLENLNQLGNAFAKLRQSAGRAEAVRPTPTVPKPVSPTNAPQLSPSIKRIADWIGTRLGDAVLAPIKAPFQVLGASISLATRAVTSVVGPLARLATIAVGSAGAGGIVALGAAIVFVGVPLFNLAVTWQLLRRSFRWAQDAAEDTFRVIARTRRTFPGLIGEAFEQAQGRVEDKLNVAEALFGDQADAMQEQITRRFTEFRMGRGLRGARDIFARWGITPGALQAWERGREQGERADLTDWLALFIRKREEIDARILSSPQGSRARAQAVRAKGMLIDDSLKLFNQNFSNIIATWSTEDVKRLFEGMARARPLGEFEDSTRATIDFRKSWEVTKAVFWNLKRGITGDIQPTLTKMMDFTNQWLLEVDVQGRSMGMQLRRLGSALAIHAWETMVILLRRIKAEDIIYFFGLLKNWEPSKVIGILESAPAILNRLADTFDYLAWYFSWFRNAKSFAEWLTAAVALPYAPQIAGRLGISQPYTPGAGRRAMGYAPDTPASRALAVAPGGRAPPHGTPEFERWRQTPEFQAWAAQSPEYQQWMRTPGGGKPALGPTRA